MISKQAKEKKARELKQNKAVEVKEKNDDWFPPISSPVVGIGFVGLVGLALYYGRAAGYIKKYKTVSGNTVPEGRVKTLSYPKPQAKQNLNVCIKN